MRALTLHLHHAQSLPVPMTCALIGGRVHVLLTPSTHHSVPMHMQETLLSVLLSDLGVSELDSLRLCRDLRRQSAASAAAVAGRPVS